MVKKRHNKIIKQAKGYFGSRKNVFQTANEAVAKAGNYAYRDRRVKKRDFRRLWIARIGAACRNGGTRYSTFIHALSQSGDRTGPQGSLGHGDQRPGCLYRPPQAGGRRGLIPPVEQKEKARGTRHGLFW